MQTLRLAMLQRAMHPGMHRLTYRLITNPHVGPQSILHGIAAWHGSGKGEMESRQQCAQISASREEVQYKTSFRWCQALASSALTFISLY